MNSKGSAITVGIPYYNSKGRSFSVEDSRFINNKADYGGAIWFPDFYDDIRFTRCKFIGNSANIDGGAIYFNILNSNPIFDLILDQVEFISNMANSRGGGLFLSGPLRNLQVNSSFFFNNSAVDSGGAIYIGSGESFSFLNTSFEKNEGDTGGAIILQSLIGKDFDVNGCNFTSNLGSSLGASIVIKGSSPLLSIKNSYFRLNNGRLSGGAVLIQQSSKVTEIHLENNLFDGNEAFFGASLSIYAPFSLLSIVSSTFTNQSGQSGSLLYLDASYSKSVEIEGNLTIQDCFVGNNSNVVSGAISIIGGTLSQLNVISSNFYGNQAREGGAININSQSHSVSIYNSTFQYNSANFGGAIRMGPSSLTNQVMIQHTRFDGNSADSNGGAVSISGVHSIFSFLVNNFTRNLALSNGGSISGIFSPGFRSPYKFKIEESTFTQNEASLNGGALHLVGLKGNGKRQSNSSSIIISNTKFEHNEASSGSSLSLIDSTSTLFSNSFDQNTILATSGTLYLESNDIPPKGLSFSDNTIVIVANNTSDLSFISCNDGKYPNANETIVQCINITVLTIASSGANIIYITSEPPPVSKSIIIGSAIGGGILLIIIILVIVFLVVRLRRQRILRQRNNFSLIDFSQINVGGAKDSMLNFDELNNLKAIGSGAFGVVYKADWRESKVAVKQIKSDDVTASQLTEFLREVEILKGLRSHPNLVLFIGITFPPQPLSLITEFCEGGLFEYLRKNQVGMEQKMAFIIGTARGILHLHKEGIIHRDLAVRNILLSKHLEPKVSDFGLSRESKSVDNAAVTSTAVGPLKWMSPESITDRKYSSKSDAWSFGVVIWEILCEKDPFADLNPVEAAIRVTTKGETLVIPPDSPPKLTKLMIQCWQRQPEDRPDFSQICVFLDEVEENDNVIDLVQNEHYSKHETETAVYSQPV